ncbi:hypothetical protein D8Y23_06895 [Microbacterium enclense]|uniref:Uncharacterized protein n=1 Tax=Microbacterium enclense TaxID=993073 RepID=A0A443JIX6_9MICO|nr:hypothetical protein [Microbacterium enclense]RWR19966.1 hypothetical protein D8Y23_06895 [Microbacterium enclense]
MITTPVHDDIQAFAAAVRAHLDDLPADEVDDLLDGLEADLSDQAAEAGDDFTLPDATTYAAELRAAAGLPERTDTPRATGTPILQRAAALGRSVDAQIRRNPAAAWTLDLLASLRPLWWILRAVVLYLFIAPFFWSGYGWMSGPIAYLFGAVQFPGIVLMTGLLLVSVQWGRGRWAPNRIARGFRTAVTVVAVLLTPFTLAALGSNLQSMVWDSSNGSSVGASFTPGLSVDGQRVRNIFAFDAEGNAIPMVQLFDQDGNPLTTIGRENGPAPYDAYFYGGGGPVPVPYTAPGASDTWNVFPLREIPPGDMAWDPFEDVKKATATEFPFLRVQPVPTDVAPSPAATTGAVPDATPTPGATTLADPTPAPVTP